MPRAAPACPASSPSGAPLSGRSRPQLALRLSIPLTVASTRIQSEMHHSAYRSTPDASTTAGRGSGRRVRSTPKRDGASVPVAMANAVCDLFDHPFKTLHLLADRNLRARSRRRAARPAHAGSTAFRVIPERVRVQVRMFTPEQRSSRHPNRPRLIAPGLAEMSLDLMDLQSSVFGRYEF